MTLLDDSKKLTQYDRHQVYASIKMLPDQLDHSLQISSQVSLPETYRHLDHVVVAGMGGSHLGAQIINHTFRGLLTTPLIIEHQYTPPAFIGKNSLVIATSYSGNTEEILEFSQKSLELGAKLICVATGGRLASLAQAHNLPLYLIDNDKNPSTIPRYGTASMFIAQLDSCLKAQILNLPATDVRDTIPAAQAAIAAFDLDQPQEKNPAKQIATSVHNHIAVLVASEHLKGSVYLMKNQLNESAKHFSVMFDLPELNHHLLESLAHPQNLSDEITFVFMESNRYHPRIIERYRLTQEIVAKQGFSSIIYQAQAPTLLGESIQVMALAGLTGYYLSYLNQIDPGPHPWVDYFKAQLAKSVA
jgi:glucose/mannose-6-phosphate isomerase